VQDKETGKYGTITKVVGRIFRVDFDDGEMGIFTEGTILLRKADDLDE
jgi:hypothetical protein